MPRRPPHHRHVPSSAIASLLERGRSRLDAVLAPWVEDEEDRRFILRCILDEGPAHHRGANYVLLALLGEAAGKVRQGKPGKTIAVPMRLPPHLADEREDAGEDDVFPLRFPLEPLLRLAKEGSPELEAMVDCLTDGPPQHSLANAAMVCLLAAILEREDSR